VGTARLATFCVIGPSQRLSVPKAVPGHRTPKEARQIKPPGIQDLEWRIVRLVETPLSDRPTTIHTTSRVSLRIAPPMLLESNGRADLCRRQYRLGLPAPASDKRRTTHSLAPCRRRSDDDFPRRGRCRRLPLRYPQAGAFDQSLTS